MTDIRNKFGRVGDLLADWDARGEVSELERDLALSLLRDIYSALKFGEPVLEPAPASAPVSESAHAPASLLAEARVQASSPPVEGWRPKVDGVVLPTEPEPESEPEPEPKPVLPIVPRRLSSEMIRSLYGTEDELTPEQEHEIETETEPETESETEPAPAPEPESAQTPSEEARAQAGSPPVEGWRPKVDGEVSSPPVEGWQAQPDGVVLPTVPEPQPVPPPAPEQRQTVPEQRQTVPAPEPKSPPRQHSKPIIGEVISTGTKTLGETLRTPGKGERDVATRIAAAQAAHTPGLKRSIGLNDRFLMIRDMFSGDADAFDRAITRLDTFTDLDDAVIWMRQNFDWNADSPGANLLVGLLERKFGR